MSMSIFKRKHSQDPFVNMIAKGLSTGNDLEGIAQGGESVIYHSQKESFMRPDEAKDALDSFFEDMMSFENSALSVTIPAHHRRNSFDEIEKNSSMATTPTTLKKLKETIDNHLETETGLIHIDFIKKIISLSYEIISEQQQQQLLQQQQQGTLNAKLTSQLTKKNLISPQKLKEIVSNCRIQRIEGIGEDILTPHKKNIHIELYDYHRFISDVISNLSYWLPGDDQKTITLKNMQETAWQALNNEEDWDLEKLKSELSQFIQICAVHRSAEHENTALDETNNFYLEKDTNTLKHARKLLDHEKHQKIKDLLGAPSSKLLYAARRLTSKKPITEPQGEPSVVIRVPCTAIRDPQNPEPEKTESTVDINKKTNHPGFIKEISLFEFLKQQGIKRAFKVKQKNGETYIKWDERIPSSLKQKKSDTNENDESVTTIHKTLDLITDDLSSNESLTIHQIEHKLNQHLNNIKISLHHGLNLLKAGPTINNKEKMNIIQQMAKALDYARENGQTYRDIKPDNILWDGTTARFCDLESLSNDNEKIRQEPPRNNVLPTNRSCLETHGIGIAYTTLFLINRQSAEELSDKFSEIINHIHGLTAKEEIEQANNEYFNEYYIQTMFRLAQETYPEITEEEIRQRIKTQAEKPNLATRNEGEVGISELFTSTDNDTDKQKLCKCAMATLNQTQKDEVENPVEFPLLSMKTNQYFGDRRDDTVNKLEEKFNNGKDAGGRNLAKDIFDENSKTLHWLPLAWQNAICQANLIQQLNNQKTAKSSPLECWSWLSQLRPDWTRNIFSRFRDNNNRANNREPNRLIESIRREENSYDSNSPLNASANESSTNAQDGSLSGSTRELQLSTTSLNEAFPVHDDDGSEHSENDSDHTQQHESDHALTSQRQDSDLSSIYLGDSDDEKDKKPTQRVADGRAPEPAQEEGKKKEKKKRFFLSFLNRSKKPENQSPHEGTATRRRWRPRFGKKRIAAAPAPRPEA